MGADGFLVTKDANKRYFTGVGAIMGHVVVTRSEGFIVTAARHHVQMQEQCPDFTVMRGGWDAVAELCRKVGTVMFEEDHLTVRAHSVLAAAGARLKESDGLLEKVRSVKSQDEVALIRRACAIADAAFEHICTFIRAGMSEDEIAAEIDHFMRRNGAEDRSFKTLVSSGARCYLPHSAATGKAVADGDFILMDFGAVRDGYCSDITRTVVVGHADETQRRLYGLVQAAQQQAVDAIRPGLAAGAADAVARDLITANTEVGCYDYGLGHGVGIEVHEEPRMVPGSAALLRDGNVVSVEPGIYIPGWGGIRIEDTVWVRGTGCEPLTKASKELRVL